MGCKNSKPYLFSLLFPFSNFFFFDNQGLSLEIRGFTVTLIACAALWVVLSALIMFNWGKIYIDKKKELLDETTPEESTSLLKD